MGLGKQLAKEAVLRCATEFVRLGWNVFFPLDEDGPIDFVIHKEQFLRVQIKATKLKRGTIRIKMASTKNWSNKLYTTEDCDLIIAYDYENRKGYLAWIADFEGMPEVTLRVSPAKNNQKRHIREAGAYLFFDDKQGKSFKYPLLPVLDVPP